MLARFGRSFFPLLDHFDLSPASDGVLREMLTICRKEGISATLLLMPESKGFHGLYSRATCAAFSQYLKGLSREFRVPVFDTHDWVVDGGFADGFHLCLPGTDLYTERLGREILGPLVAGQASSFFTTLPPTLVKRKSRPLKR
jgi:hypothetical protein